MDQVFTDEDGNEIDLTRAVDDFTRLVFDEAETEAFYNALVKLRVIRNRTFQIDDSAEYEKFVAKFSPPPQQQQYRPPQQQQNQRYQPIQAQKRTIGSVDDGTAIPGENFYFYSILILLDYRVSDAYYNGCRCTVY